MQDISNSVIKYTRLISSLPVMDQAFTMKANNWQKYLSDIHFKEIFKYQENICLSRREVHDNNNIDLFILKTILWGYPKGMRGNNFGKIYSRLNDLSEILNISNRAFLKTDDLYELQKRLKTIDGLGLSTYSKLLYFRDFKFDGVPALILDERLIRVFKNKVFAEFEPLAHVTQYNSEKMYSTYLQLMDQLSKQLN
ncbi:8-oxoguanine DNA glycosylase OGG fold protein [Epilithonimonas hominis]|uniref:Uncharacterized protein n=1 Tax=Epilithonimonas hominis TaxID=420404 RepID=A0A3N0XBP2_9FLAO|nr:hypothetical protein [Epilithonimonas hominis]ROI14817.1 hypothetical protein EGH73_01230 [Epilithonimonas hominis]